MPSLGDEALRGSERDVKAGISPEARQSPGEVAAGEGDGQRRRGWEPRLRAPRTGCQHDEPPAPFSHKKQSLVLSSDKAAPAGKAAGPPNPADVTPSLWSTLFTFEHRLSQKWRMFYSCCSYLQQCNVTPPIRPTLEAGSGSQPATRR